MCIVNNVQMFNCQSHFLASPHFAEGVGERRLLGLVDQVSWAGRAFFRSSPAKISTTASRLIQLGTFQIPSGSCYRTPTAVSHNVEPGPAASRKCSLGRIATESVNQSRGFLSPQVRERWYRAPHDRSTTHIGASGWMMICQFIDLPDVYPISREQLSRQRIVGGAET